MQSISEPSKAQQVAWLSRTPRLCHSTRLPPLGPSGVTFHRRPQLRRATWGGEVPGSPTSSVGVFLPPKGLFYLQCTSAAALTVTLLDESFLKGLDCKRHPGDGARLLARSLGSAVHPCAVASRTDVPGSLLREKGRLLLCSPLPTRHPMQKWPPLSQNSGLLPKLEDFMSEAERGWGLLLNTNASMSCFNHMVSALAPH